MNALHQAVTRAIAEAAGRPWTPTEQQAAATTLAAAEPLIRADERRVCLAEAQRAVVPIVADCICSKRVTCDECLDTARGWVAEALAALTEEQADA